MLKCRNVANKTEFFFRFSGQCSLRCIRDDSCNAFTFDSETNTCQLGTKKNPKAMMPTSAFDKTVQINVIAGT
jgi:hypothetical protein